MPDKFLGHTLEGATMVGAIDVEPARPATLVRLVLQQVHAGGLLPAAVAASLLSPVAIGAPGDLDPTFGDVGRLFPVTDKGPIWAVEATEDGFLYAGGDHYCGWYTCEEPVGFFGQVTGAGANDLDYDSAVLAKTVVYDMATQPDGKAVATGFVQQVTGVAMTVYRLLPDGAPDPSFGTDGIVNLTDAVGNHQVGRSVVIEPDGRVVVSGERGSNRIVVRLLANGDLDTSFGTGGTYVGPVANAVGGGLVRAPGGGYRALVDSPCRVVALDANGVRDATFGSAGFAPAHPAAPQSVSCSDLAVQADGSLLIAGNRLGTEAFVTRLLPSGAKDPGFNGDAVADLMNNATAVAPGHDGAIMVAGYDSTGSDTVVYRLQSNGSIDTLFGNDGAAVVELESFPKYYSTTILDMHVLADDGIVMAGRGAYKQPFVAKLAGAGAGPGIASIKTSDVIAARNGQAVIDVRRVGGSAGAVSVAYTTQPESATAGSDYTTTSGRLSWGDGDRGNRQITVPILAGGASSTQAEESFQVILSDPEGGAGLGTYGAYVRLDVPGFPAGMISATPVGTVTNEGLIVQFQVHRLFYSVGAVSVTVTPVGRTATAGDDFVATPVVVTWGDGDASSKLVSVTINNDKKDERAEAFSVVLSAPTGGASISSDPPADVTINASDRGGGGRFGALAALLLGIAGLRRRRYDMR